MFEHILQNDPAERLKETIASVHTFHPYPTAQERPAWDSIPLHKKSVILRRADDAAGNQWPVLKASDFMAYHRSDDRAVYERKKYRRLDMLAALVLGECATSDHRYLDKVIDGVWMVCEESYWGISAHNGRVPDALPDVNDTFIELFVAETGMLLAWCTYLLKDRLDGVSGRIRRRIYQELENRIIVPFLAQTDYWWMGATDHRVNNWTPWIVANVLTVLLLSDYNEMRRIDGVVKCLSLLDLFCAVYHSDGGCDEGAAYWNYAGGALFDSLDLLYKASNGRIDFGGDPLLKNIGRYIVTAHIHEDYFVNFADCPAKPTAEADLIHRFGAYLNDRKMMGLAALLQSDRRDRYSLRRELPAAFCGVQRGRVESELADLDVWLDGIQMAVSRQYGQSGKGLYLAAKGGHNGESHNHNDVGSCIVFKDGKPGFIDVGVETYTKKTFSSNRYEIWTMQSGYHNVPLINQCMQLDGAEHRTADVRYTGTSDGMQLQIDLAGAYPASCGATAYVRRYDFVRKDGRIVITDRYLFRSSCNTVSLVFISQYKPMPANGAIRYDLGDGGELYLEYDHTRLHVDIESCDSGDPRLSEVWGPYLYRTVLMAEDLEEEGELSVEIH